MKKIKRQKPAGAIFFGSWTFLINTDNKKDQGCFDPDEAPVQIQPRIIFLPGGTCWPPAGLVF